MTSPLSRFTAWITRDESGSYTEFLTHSQRMDAEARFLEGIEIPPGRFDLTDEDIADLPVLDLDAEDCPFR